MKIRFLQFGALSVMIQQVVPVVGSIVFVTSGSTPYYWVIQFGLVLLAPVSLVFSTFGLSNGAERPSSKRWSKDISKTDTKSSKLEIQVTAVVMTASDD